MLPAGVALDGTGRLLIVDAFNNAVWLANLTTSAITTFGQSIPAGRMEVVAGNDTFGYGGDGGPAVAAALAGPSGVAVDGAGNLYIADTLNNRIRRVAAGTGTIRTVAGTGSVGYGGDGGPATHAILDNPSGVAVDGIGNLYIADQGNFRIREVLAGAGTIHTVAGDGSPGCYPSGLNCYGGDGGPATQAELDYPQDVAVDGSGNLFIADTYNQRIREVPAATGIITTVAGSGTAGYGGDGGPATQAELNYPAGVALDAAGDLFVADTDNNRVREVVAGKSVITTVAGNGSPGCIAGVRGDCFGGDGGPATQAELALPGGVAVDAMGNIFIADSDNSRARAVTASGGIISTVAGDGARGYGGDGGPATQAELNLPAGVAPDGSGDLFVADTANNRIREVVAPSGRIVTVAGTGLAAFKGDGGPATHAALHAPTSVAVDGAGNIFIADSANNRVREVIASSGVITTVAGDGKAGFGGDGGPATQAALNQPNGVALDSAGNLFIADYANNRVREVLAAGGVITTVAGTGRPGYGGDGGPAVQARLYHPAGVAVDGADTLFIADMYNYRIRAVTSSDIITTVAGDGTGGDGGDGGPATQAALNYPVDVAVDATGNLLIADTYNDRIREVVASSGIITTVAGTGMGGFSGDGGPATAAQVDLPNGVAVGGAGNLLIADTNNNRVRYVRYG